MKKPNNAIDPLAEERDLASKKVVRRRDAGKVVAPEALEPRNIKVQISIELDADVLEYFKAQASKLGASSYETPINQALRDVLNREGETSTREASAPGENESPEQIVAEINDIFYSSDASTRRQFGEILHSIRDLLRERTQRNLRKLA